MGEEQRREGKRGKHTISTLARTRYRGNWAGFYNCDYPTPQLSAYRFLPFPSPFFPPPSLFSLPFAFPSSPSPGKRYSRDVSLGGGGEEGGQTWARRAICRICSPVVGSMAARRGGLGPGEMLALGRIAEEVRGRGGKGGNHFV